MISLHVQDHSREILGESSREKYHETKAAAKAKIVRAKESRKPSRKLIRIGTKSLPGFRRCSLEMVWACLNDLGGTWAYVFWEMLRDLSYVVWQHTVHHGEGACGRHISRPNMPDRYLCLHVLTTSYDILHQTNTIPDHIYGIQRLEM